jgi:hypothetical protein
MSGHVCDACFRDADQHMSRDCDAYMEGPWECQSWPMHCCRGCPCGSFEQAHPDDREAPR